MMTIQQLHKTFNRLKTNTVDGISGVFRIDSGKPGPILGITACTHGNEPSGLAIFDYLLNERNISEELQRGVLYLIVNNIKATERFFKSKNKEEVRKARYVDINMNRLPRNTLRIKNDERYEIIRTKELYPILKRLEYGLDVHSTLERSDPVIISIGDKFHFDLVRGFPINKILSNIDKIQIGIPISAFYGGLTSNAKVFAIESGQHTDPKSFKRAVTCTISFLENLEMLRATRHRTIKKYEEYYINDSIVFRDISFDFVKEFKSYDAIQKGRLLARNKNGLEIYANKNGHLIMPTSLRGTDKYLNEEATFVSRPVKVRRVG